MYIFNTTYHVEDSVKKLFTEWLRRVYIPAAATGETLSRPQLCRVIAGETTDGESLSLQFHVADRASLESWYEKQGADLDRTMREKFGDRVIGFNTLLEILD